MAHSLKANQWTKLRYLTIPFLKHPRDRMFTTEISGNALVRNHATHERKCCGSILQRFKLLQMIQEPRHLMRLLHLEGVLWMNPPLIVIKENNVLWTRALVLKMMI